MKEKKACVEDAMRAARAAVEEGIGPGGVALVRAATILAALPAPEEEEEEKTGVQIVRRAMEEPARCIALNAGVNGSVVLDKIKNNNGAFGWFKVTCSSFPT